MPLNPIGVAGTTPLHAVPRSSAVTPIGCRWPAAAPVGSGDSTTAKPQPANNHVSSTADTRFDTLDDALAYVLGLSMPSASEKQLARQCVMDLQQICSVSLADGHTWRLSTFGGSENGFGMRGSDVDIVAHIHGGQEDRSASSASLRSMIGPLKEHPHFHVKAVVMSARVPILKLTYRRQCDVDFSVNNTHPLRNTRLLKAYSQIDHTIVELGVAIKLWAKAEDICGAAMGHLSSYSFILLVIYFLQVTAVGLPCLQEEGCTDSTFEDDSKSEAASRRVQASWRLGESLSSLFCKFFEFYGRTFRWGIEVVSVRMGRRLDAGNAAFAALPYVEEGRLHIEDPIDRSRNLRDVLVAKNEATLFASLRAAHCKIQNGKAILVVLGGSDGEDHRSSTGHPTPPPRGRRVDGGYPGRPCQRRGPIGAGEARGSPDVLLGGSAPAAYRQPSVRRPGRRQRGAW